LDRAAFTVRNVTWSNSSSRNSVVGIANGDPGRGATSLTCVENGVATGRGNTNSTSMPMALIALVSP
jgi:hypothetical protein